MQGNSFLAVIPALGDAQETRHQLYFVVWILLRRPSAASVSLRTLDPGPMLLLGESCGVLTRPAFSQPNYRIGFARLSLSLFSLAVLLPIIAALRSRGLIHSFFFQLGLLIARRRGARQMLRIET